MPIPLLLRPSVMMFFARQTINAWRTGGFVTEVGDGRERACAEFVKRVAERGNAASVLRAIDEFALGTSWLMSVGPVKGAILGSAVERARPRFVLELGTYVGYSTIIIASRAPKGCRVFSVEFSAVNAEVAREIIEFAGLADVVTVVHGYMGDPAKRTIATLNEALLKANGGAELSRVDLMFVDHVKQAYLPDMAAAALAGWLRSGSVVVADNVLLPGAPAFRWFLHKHSKSVFDVTDHWSWVEYQGLLPDVVVEAKIVGSDDDLRHACVGYS